MTASASRVKTGSTVLAEQGFASLSGKTIGFIGNHTSVLADGTPTVHALISSGRAKVVRLFSPEHGVSGQYDDKVGDEIDPATGLPVYSLYGDHRKPSHDAIADLDLLVFELQDIGARFYTYASTLFLAIDAAFESGKKILVLDRPNPINGVDCEGPIADLDKVSFTAGHALPIRHGMTLGELALLYATEKTMSGAVEVVACERYTRNQWFNDTGLDWINPSPAMRSLDAATLYPGVCLLEQTNVSVGRGTEMPFSAVGAPFINGISWSDAVNELSVPGVITVPHRFTPVSSKFSGEKCGGIKATVTDRNTFRPVLLGMALLSSLNMLYKSEFELTKAQTLLANDATFRLLCCDIPPVEIEASWAGDNIDWSRRRAPHLLYQNG